MYNQHYLEVIEEVLARNLPDEALADAINQQLSLITHRSGDINDQDPSLQ